MGATKKHEAEAARVGTLELFEPVSVMGQGEVGAKAEGRHSSQRDAILALLLERGRAGITNTELNSEVCFRYGARIFELRRMGHRIETVAEGDGVFRFILEPGPVPAAGGQQEPNAPRNDSRQVRPPGKVSANAHSRVARAGGDLEAETGRRPKGEAPYNLGLLDHLQHAMPLQRKFAEHRFNMNARGDALCPACGTAMVRAEKQEGFAQHYVCPNGLVFYGDTEGLNLCLHPAEDTGCPACSGG